MLRVAGGGNVTGGRVALVTGASSGIGLALVRLLLNRGYDVLAVVRSPMPGDRMLEEARSTGTLRMHHADLSDPGARAGLIHDLSERERVIDVIFNNAGVSTGSMEFSKADRELHYEVNCLAPYELTVGLLPLLATGGSVVNTASDAIRFVRRYDPARLARPAAFRVVTGPYASSKLALVLWSHALVERIAAKGARIVSASPGAVDTPLIRGPGFPRLLRPLARLISVSPETAAETLFAAYRGSCPSGSLVVKGRAATVPFIEHTTETLRVVSADHAAS